MNTQELETVRRLNLPIKFFILDNDGMVLLDLLKAHILKKDFMAPQKMEG